MLLENNEYSNIRTTTKSEYEGDKTTEIIPTRQTYDGASEIAMEKPEGTKTHSDLTNSYRNVKI